MSVSMAESEVKRSRASLQDARNKQAAEDNKAADLEKAAASKEQSAQRTSSGSLAWENLTPLDAAEREHAEELARWLRDRGAKSAAELGGRTR